MRGIEFRGYSEKYNKWVYGDLIVGNDNETFIALKGKISTIGGEAYNYDEGFGFRDGEIFLVNKHTIGQFTELYDINNKKIYDGDIIETKTIGCHIYSEVIFTKGIFALKNGFALKEYRSNMKIIGNIYENKELLNV